jgi:putative phosphoribosyl transferase
VWEGKEEAMEFRDRYEAGRRLGEQLVGNGLAGADTVVLGLPRGGVPVAALVAEALGAPLDVVVVRKLGVPFQPELALGAVGEGGALVLDRDVVRMAGVDEDQLAALEERERAEVERRAERVRAGRPPVSVEGRTAVVIDDGVATGSTARAACQVVRSRGASRVVLAVPVAPRASIRSLAEVADQVICLEMPEPFFAVGQFYEDFTQVSDDEVAVLLERADAHLPVDAGIAADDPPVRDEDVEVTAGPVRLTGHLTVPERCSGLVIFAHGSGSSRHSPRNRFVAATLNAAGLGTLLFDLLTPEEELERSAVFDVELLAERLCAVTSWLLDQPQAEGRRVGYFGASTGAAAALWAAAEPGSKIAAVVSRGGRPDLAGPRLADVRAPTLLIVGGDDDVVLQLNRHAQRQLACENRVVVVAGATHLFEEPGALEEVADLARTWFVDFLEPAVTGKA